VHLPLHPTSAPPLPTHDERALADLPPVTRSEGSMSLASARLSHATPRSRPAHLTTGLSVSRLTPPSPLSPRYGACGTQDSRLRVPRGLSVARLRTRLLTTGVTTIAQLCWLPSRSFAALLTTRKRALHRSPPETTRYTHGTKGQVRAPSSKRSSKTRAWALGSRPPCAAAAAAAACTLERVAAAGRACSLREVLPPHAERAAADTL